MDLLKRNQYKIYMFLIIVLSFFLNTWEIWNKGFDNIYYSAGIKSMLLNLHNFFYVSFDPTGFVNIDKPPLGFHFLAPQS